MDNTSVPIGLNGILPIIESIKQQSKDVTSDDSRELADLAALKKQPGWMILEKQIKELIAQTRANDSGIVDGMTVQEYGFRHLASVTSVLMLESLIAEVNSAHEYYLSIHHPGESGSDA